MRGRRRWRVRGKEGEDFGVRLEGDEDGFGRRYASAVSMRTVKRDVSIPRLLYGAGRVGCDAPARQTIVQTDLRCLELLP